MQCTWQVLFLAAGTNRHDSSNAEVSNTNAASLSALAAYYLNTGCLGSLQVHKICIVMLRHSHMNCNGTKHGCHHLCQVYARAGTQHIQSPCISCNHDMTLSWQHVAVSMPGRLTAGLRCSLMSQSTMTLSKSSPPARIHVWLCFACCAAWLYTFTIPGQCMPSVCYATDCCAHISR